MRCVALWRGVRRALRTRLRLTRLHPLRFGSGADGALELRAEGGAGADTGPPPAADAGGKKRKEKDDKKDKKERKRVRHTRGAGARPRRVV